MAADLKWDMTTTENLYGLAIVQRRDLHSVRDLDQSHLPLLRNVRDKCLAAIKEKFKLPRLDSGTFNVIFWEFQPNNPANVRC